MTNLGFLLRYNGQLSFALLIVEVRNRHLIILYELVLTEMTICDINNINLLQWQADVYNLKYFLLTTHGIRNMYGWHVSDSFYSKFKKYCTLNYPSE